MKELGQAYQNQFRGVGFSQGFCLIGFGLWGCGVSGLGFCLEFRVRVVADRSLGCRVWGFCLGV